MKCGGQVGGERRSNWLDFLFELFMWFFTIERWDQKQHKYHDISKSWGRIMTKLGGWVGFVTRTSRLYFRSGPNTDLTHQWDTKRKLFSLVEVCALPSAILVLICYVRICFVFFSSTNFCTVYKKKLLSFWMQHMALRSIIYWGPGCATAAVPPAS